MDYFKKFRNLNYRKDPKLKIEPSYKVLWVDEDMLEDMALGKSMRRVLNVINAIPKNVEIKYCGHDNALDELVENAYSLVILDNDAYRGQLKGPSTLKEIRKFDREVPVVYTSSSPREISGDYVRDNVQLIVQTTDLPTKIGEIIEKYVLGVKNE